MVKIRNAMKKVMRPGPKSRSRTRAKRARIALVLSSGLASVFLLSIVGFGSLRADSRSISADELARHSAAESCWIAISGNVYDITDYLNEHATLHKYSLLPWCGKDATSGWKSKDNKGQPHTRKASIQLKRYKIGELQQ